MEQGGGLNLPRQRKILETLRNEASNIPRILSELNPLSDIGIAKTILGAKVTLFVPIKYFRFNELSLLWQYDQGKFCLVS